MNALAHPDVLIAQIIVLFFAVGLHEYAHCKFADLAGDPTPRYYGRVTLNLFKHFDAAGCMMMLFTLVSGYGIGWGKPAPMDASKMRNPRVDLFIAVAAGPISNLCQAVVYALFVRLTVPNPDSLAALGPVGGFLGVLAIYGVIINLAMFCFNLIPFGPLDGHWLVGLLLPEKLRVSWFRFNRTVGVGGLFILIIGMQVLHISLLSKPILMGFKLLTGQDL